MKKSYQQTTRIALQEPRRTPRTYAHPRGTERRVTSKTIPTRKPRVDRKSEMFFAGGLFLILLAKLFVRVFDY